MTNATDRRHPAQAHRPNVYAGGGLDRIGDLRRDHAWITEQLGATQTRIVPVWRSQNLIVTEPGGSATPSVVLVPATETAAAGLLAEPILLGRHDDTTYFAVDVSAIPQPEQHPLFAERGVFTDLRSVGSLMSGPQSSLLAYARGLVFWHSRHRFCGVCGHATITEEAGHVRTCTNPACNAQHWPRTDPAVIMLVHRDDRCLLARSPRFRPGMFSTLAGFVEPGESLEETVIREVMEEVGVRIDALHYHSSQPWPFPASIMLGFHAHAATTAITLQPTELEDAHWFSRDALRAARDEGSDLLPGGDSIARRLIEDWLDSAP